MWPLMLDMTKQESKSMLKSLEREAYSSLVSALRAQGSLNEEKLKILKELSVILNISQQSHKAEVRRAVNDERLRTIAYIITGVETTDDWAMEGRRTIPLLSRIAPQTAYSTIADQAADNASLYNDQLPYPSQTERKRSLLQPITNDVQKKHLPIEDNYGNKKRKLASYVTDSPNSSQFVGMGPPKISRIQQIYRQKTKQKLKDQQQKLLNEEKRNKEDIQTQSRLSPIPGCSGERSPKFRTHPVLSKSVPQLQPQSIPQTTSSDHKILQSNRHTPKGQKLVLVSNASTTSVTSPSILQRSLQSGTINVKALEKVKIVGTTTSPALQLNSVITTTAVLNKPKMVTMRTNSTTKKLNIPILQGVQLQALGTKGSVKMLPVSGKIVTKTTSSSGTPIYFVNPIGNSVTTTAVLKENSKVVETDKCKEVENMIMHTVEMEESKDKLMEATLLRIEKDPDIESHISKLTEIPRNDDKLFQDVGKNNINESSVDFESQIENAENKIQTIVELTTNYEGNHKNLPITEIECNKVTTGENEEYLTVIQDSLPEEIYVVGDEEEHADVVICHIDEKHVQHQDETSEEDVHNLIEALDPETGQYTVQSIACFGLEPEAVNQRQEISEKLHKQDELFKDGYVIIENNSDTEVNQPSSSIVP